MFLREKHIRGRTYLYLVESVRENGKPKQRIVANLGRKEAVLEGGDLDRLVRSISRYAPRSIVLSLLEDGGAALSAARRIGPPLLFERLWREAGCEAVLREQLKDRQFQFSVERAVFLSVLHRIMVSGSDRQANKWRSDYRIDGVEEIMLHHLYRAMAWLGEVLPENDQGDRTPFSPRCIKDRIEEALFARRRDLFTEITVAFMDTTTLYFEGEGGETLGKRGFSKDHRPDLHQMVLGVVMDQDGRPVCCEMWPGNTADVTTLLPVIDRLRHRFGVRRVCVVADRGMICEETVAALEERGLEYLLGVRERSSNEARAVVLNDTGAFTPLVVTRTKGQETDLEAKEVKIGKRRYIVCRNPAEQARDAAQREQIVSSLKQKLKSGDKALVGNKGYRRYIKTPKDDHFEIDETKVAEDAQFDGLWVLRTNTRLTPLQSILCYRDLIRVERLFRNTKSLLETRPIFHQTDEAIRGHVFCSFLALILLKDLDDKLTSRGVKFEWADILADLDRVQEFEIEQDGKRFLLRTPTTGCAGKVFQAVGVALPPNMRQLAKTVVAAPERQNASHP